MSCELTTYTTNVTDCCYLQILCNGTVVREFNLAELRVVDKGDSFMIRDRVGSMDFSNATIDVTAEDVRTLRCSCASAAAACTFYQGGVNYYNIGVFSNGYGPGDEALAIDFMELAQPELSVTECYILSYTDLSATYTHVAQVQNGVLTYVIGYSTT